MTASETYLLTIIYYRRTRNLNGRFLDADSGVALAGYVAELVIHGAYLYVCVCLTELMNLITAQQLLSCCITHLHSGYFCQGSNDSLDCFLSWWK